MTKSKCGYRFCAWCRLIASMVFKYDLKAISRILTIFVLLMVMYMDRNMPHTLTFAFVHERIMQINRLYVHLRVTNIVQPFSLCFIFFLWITQCTGTLKRILHPVQKPTLTEYRGVAGRLWLYNAQIDIFHMRCD